MRARRGRRGVDMEQQLTYTVLYRLRLKTGVSLYFFAKSRLIRLLYRMLYHICYKVYTLR